jgi:multicomponent Na+:H+ antiporter subunit B
MSTVIARTVTRTVVPLILVTAIALLLQGHNLPGGGFIAGVLSTVAIVLVTVIYGEDYVENELLHRPSGWLQSGTRSVFGLGLALATGGGIAAMGVGAPFLTQAVRFVHVPIYGELELASAFVFDLGVTLVVVGALLSIVTVLGGEGGS